MPVTFDNSNVNPTPSKKKGGKPRAVKPDTPPKLDEAIESHLPRTPAGRQSKDLKTIQDGLQQAFTFLGIGVSMFNLYDAMVIHENSELLAKHWTKVAEQNPTVRKYLLNALQGGVWAGAITTTIAVVIPIAANHTELPDEVVKATAGIGVSLPDDELKGMASPMSGGYSANGDSSAT
jgi:hypothetical protein